MPPMVKKSAATQIVYYGRHKLKISQEKLNSILIDNIQSGKPAKVIFNKKAKAMKAKGMKAKKA